MPEIGQTCFLYPKIQEQFSKNSFRFLTKCQKLKVFGYFWSDVLIKKTKYFKEYGHILILIISCTKLIFINPVKKRKGKTYKD